MRNGLKQTIKQTLCMFYERFQGLEVYNASNHVHWFYWGWIKWSWNGLLRHRTMYLNTFHLLFPPLPTKKRCITIKKTKSCKCSRLQNRVDSCGASRKAFENSCLARANPDSAPARNREVRPSDRMGWIPCTSDQTIEHLGGLQWWWTIEIGLCILCITANGDIFAGEQSVFRGVDFRGGDIQTFCVGCTVELLYEMHHIVLLRVRIDETRRDQVLGGWSDRQQRQPMV